MRANKRKFRASVQFSGVQGVEIETWRESRWTYDGRWGKVRHNLQNLKVKTRPPARENTSSSFQLPSMTCRSLRIRWQSSKRGQPAREEKITSGKKSWNVRLAASEEASKGKIRIQALLKFCVILKSFCLCFSLTRPNFVVAVDAFRFPFCVWHATKIHETRNDQKCECETVPKK